MTITRHHDAAAATLDAEEVFRFLGYDPNDPAARAVVGLCMRYQLDPFAGHIIVIQGRRSPYVTRDGHLWLAHASGQLDGIEILEEWATEKNAYAKAAVWRKDMSKPFIYTGRANLKNSRGGWDEYADKKAVANAEVRALKRAFPLQLPSIVDYEDDLEPSDPAPALPAPQQATGVGSGLTSEGPATRTDEAPDQPGRPMGRPSDTQAPEPNPPPTTAAGSGAPRPVSTTPEAGKPGRGGQKARHEGKRDEPRTPAGPQRSSERGAATDATSSVKQAGSVISAEGNREGEADPSLLPGPPGWES